MASTIVQFRADTDVKSKASDICETLGLDLPTYFRMCMSRLVQEGGIPFSLKLGKASRSQNLELLQKFNAISEQNDTNELSLDEINQEITAARKDMK